MTSGYTSQWVVWISSTPERSGGADARYGKDRASPNLCWLCRRGGGETRQGKRGINSERRRGKDKTDRSGRGYVRWRHVAERDRTAGPIAHTTTNRYRILRARRRTVACPLSMPSEGRGQMALLSKRPAGPLRSRGSDGTMKERIPPESSRHARLPRRAGGCPAEARWARARFVEGEPYASAVYASAVYVEMIPVRATNPSPEVSGWGRKDVSGDRLHSDPLGGVVAESAGAYCAVTNVR